MYLNINIFPIELLTATYLKSNSSTLLLKKLILVLGIPLLDIPCSKAAKKQSKNEKLHFSR
jgi:hypothetical protein